MTAPNNMFCGIGATPAPEIVTIIYGKRSIRAVPGITSNPVEPYVYENGTEMNIRGFGSTMEQLAFHNIMTKYLSGDRGVKYEILSTNASGGGETTEFIYILKRKTEKFG
jgi:hypothetical protein